MTETIGTEWGAFPPPPPITISYGEDLAVVESEMHHLVGAGSDDTTVAPSSTAFQAGDRHLHGGEVDHPAEASIL